MKVCLIAAPLMARSGVYRSTYDLVGAARNLGYDWSAVVGMRPSAVGEPPAGALGVEEFSLASRGSALIRDIRNFIAESETVRSADVIITLITQSDVALARSRSLRVGKKWVAFVRGLPWPDKGEQNLLRRIVLRSMESSALRQADEVWATTPLLAEQISSARVPHIVPAGIPEITRRSHGSSAEGPLIWVGRLDDDKRPDFFIDIADRVGVRADLVGDGPLRSRVAARSQEVENVEYLGWKAPADIWGESSMFLGTSRREAFGRSAVEAARFGLPVILTTEYGAAPFLFTDPDLVDQFVLPVDDLDKWERAVRSLLSSEALRRRVSNHVYENAGHLTIEASVRAAMGRLDPPGEVPVPAP